MYLRVPAPRLSHVPGGLVHAVRCQVRCDLVIAEEVVEPRTYWQVVDGLCSTLFSISPCQPAVSAAGRTASTVRMLVERQFGMFAVNESDAVVRACFDLHYATLTHFLEEALGQGPRSCVGVGGQQQKEELVHRFGCCIGHLHSTESMLACGVGAGGAQQDECMRSYLMHTHPLEVHQEHLAQCNIRVDTVLVVHLVVPPLGPRGEFSGLVVEGVELVVLRVLRCILCKQEEWKQAHETNILGFLTDMTNILRIHGRTRRKMFRIVNVLKDSPPGSENPNKLYYIVRKLWKHNKYSKDI